MPTYRLFSLAPKLCFLCSVYPHCVTAHLPTAKFYMQAVFTQSRFSKLSAYMWQYTSPRAALMHRYNPLPQPWAHSKGLLSCLLYFLILCGFCTASHFSIQRLSIFSKALQALYCLCFNCFNPYSFAQCYQAHTTWSCTHSRISEVMKN